MYVVYPVLYDDRVPANGDVERGSAGWFWSGSRMVMWSGGRMVA